MKVRRHAASGLFALILVWPLFAAAELPSTLATSWDAYRRAAQSGAAEDIAAAANALPAAAHRAGVERAPALSLLLLRDAESWLEHGDGNTALTLANAAEALAPSSPEPHRLLSRILWNGGDRWGSARERFAAWKASATDFRSSLYRAERVAAALLLSLLSVAGLVAAVFVFRALPLLAHLVEEWSGHRLFRPTAWLIAVWLLVFPFVAAAWGVWLILLPAAMAWWFLSGRERALVAGLAAAGLLVALVPPSALSVFATDDDPGLRLLVDVANGGEAGEEAARFQGGHETPVAAATRALALDRGRRDAEADTAYEEALARWPNDPRLLTNYGNLRFRRQDYAKAIELYEAAHAQARDAVVVLYNLSQAYRADLRFEEGEARFQAAQALDAGLLDTYAARTRMGDAFLVADYGFGAADLWRAAIAPRAAPPSLGGSIERLRRHAALSLTAGLVALFVLCWMVARLAPNQPAAPCATCGAAVCPRCQRYFLDSKLCSTCWKAYAKGVKLHPNAALPQALRRWDVRRRVAAVLSIIPGVGHLTLGRPWWGAGFALAGAFAWWTGWLAVSSWNTVGERLFTPPWYAVWWPSLAGAGALYAVIYLHLSTLAAPSSPAPFSDGPPRGAGREGGR